MSRTGIRKLAASLRSQRSPASLVVTAADADRKDALALISQAQRLLGSGLFAVVGEAGQGKSFLAAELTAPIDDRPAGVLLLGADLASNGTLDQLADRLPGIPVKTCDDLLEALNAAGGRAGRRLPVVIDGLNESENPLRWKSLLAELKPVLARFPFVAVVVTLRSSVADDALVPEAMRLSLEGFAHDVDEAVDRYFAHYRIDPGDARLPWARFSQPLFLRMYCEATNPLRQVEVGVEALPSSLTAVFERYRDTATERVRQRLRRPPGSVAHSLALFAARLWERNVRFLPSDELAELFMDDPRDWDGSVVRALEEEGVLWRGPGETWEDPRTGILFDAFAGFLIADALVRGESGTALNGFLDSTATWTRLQSRRDHGHPLGEDILRALVGVLPRHSSRQVWQAAPSELRDWAVAQSADLEADYLDKATIDAIADLVPRTAGARVRHQRDLFDRLEEVRGGTGHPLNARFTDKILRGMAVAERDRRWTEWIRLREDSLGEDLDHLERRWQTHASRDESDRLQALWVAWLLTSTVRPLRDRATRALYWFGRGDPRGIFSLTLEFSSVNDPYVFERLTAASYGVAMANQAPATDAQFLASLSDYLEGLFGTLFDATPASPTSHWLIRLYAQGAFEFATRVHPSAVPPRLRSTSLHAAPGPNPERIGDDDPRAPECDKTMRMDFENYTVGGLVEGRANYQSDHELYRQVLSDIRGRIWELGWRTDRFDEIDDRIAEASWRRDQRPEKTDRYGKKYGWIAYYEAAGRLADAGDLRERYSGDERLAEVDIDPSFPAAPDPADVESPVWIDSRPNDPHVWLTSASVAVPDSLLRPTAVGNLKGPWVAVDGYLRQRDDQLGREVFGFIRGLLVSQENVDSVVELLTNTAYLGNWFTPNRPSDYYTFAGEIPWSSAFAREAQYDEALEPYEAPMGRDYDGPVLELLGHDYAYEGYHSVLNTAGGTPVPSKRLSAALALHGSPQTFDQADRDGQTATLSRGAPVGFEGDLLYVREDLLRDYAAESGRSLVLVAWGERNLLRDWSDPPDWLVEARQEHADLWRSITVPEL